MITSSSKKICNIRCKKKISDVKINMEKAENIDSK